MNDLVIVSDPGIDDAIALVLIEKLLPGVPKLLISSFGNAAGSIIAKNAQDIANLLGDNWRFERGADLPVSGTVEHAWPDYFHGEDGLWGVVTPKRTANPTQHVFSYKHVLSLGPLTSVAEIIAQYSVETLTIMGGAFAVDGNETPYAETNIAFDADAAKYVFDHVQQTVVRVVPLDVTRQAAWSIDTIDRMDEHDELRSWLKQLLVTWNNRYDHSKEKDFNLHDPLAAYLLANPESITWQKSGVDVIVTGDQRGRTVFSDTNKSCYVAADAIDGKALSIELLSLL